MAEPLIHFTVPFTVLSALGVDRKRAFLASLLALTPDLDVLFRVHRSASHSFVALFLVAFPLLALSWRRRNVRDFVLLASVAVASHLLLDLTWYTPILYPLVKESYCVLVNCDFHLGSSPAISFSLDVLSRPTVFQPFKRLDAPLFTGQGLMVSMVLLAPVVLKVLGKRFFGEK